MGISCDQKQDKKKTKFGVIHRCSADALINCLSLALAAAVLLVDIQ